MMSIKRIHIIGLLVFLFALAGTPKAFADNDIQPEVTEITANEEPAEEGKLNVKDFAFAHLLDSYGFHITDIGETSISVPLPIIVKSKDRGWFVFMSSKLHHNGSYQGFSVAKPGEAYGYKIVETLPDGTKVRPWDFSITKVAFSLFVTAILLCLIFIPVARRYNKQPLKAPKGIQAMLEPIIIFIMDGVIKSAIGEGYKKYAPYLLTVFFFILTLNITGLIPIFPFGANVTGNIVIPAVLALCTYIAINIASTKGYWIEMLWSPDIPLWLKFPLPIMPFIEFLSSITKPLVLTMRLFANMMAGHLLTLVMMSLIFIFGSMGVAVAGSVAIGSVLITVFMTVLHILVAAIQAYVFTLLSAVFIGMANVKEHEHVQPKQKVKQIEVKA